MHGRWLKYSQRQHQRPLLSNLESFQAQDRPTSYHNNTSILTNTMLKPAALFGIFKSPPQKLQQREHSTKCGEADDLFSDEAKSMPVWHQDDLFGAKLFQDYAAAMSSPGSKSGDSPASEVGVQDSIYVIGDCRDQGIDTSASKPCHFSPSNSPSSNDILPQKLSKRTIDINLEDFQATLIQSYARRYLHHGTLRRLQLRKRLEEIEQNRRKTLAHIQLRKERKIAKFQRKYDKREDEHEQEYQKVSGIIHYLERDLSRLQRENEKYRLNCVSLKTENRHLLALKDHSAWNRKKKHIDRLKEANDTLRSTLRTYQEVICHMEEWQREHPSEQHSRSSRPSKRLPMGTPTLPRDAHHSASGMPVPNNQYGSPYASQIAINCDNEAEANCFHYRLVQDVYTLTPPNRTGISSTTAWWNNQ